MTDHYNTLPLGGSQQKDFKKTFKGVHQQMENVKLEENQGKAFIKYFH